MIHNGKFVFNICSFSKNIVYRKFKQKCRNSLICFPIIFFSFFYSSSSEIILPFLKVSFTARVTCRFIYIQTYRVHKIQMFFFKQVLLCTTRGLTLLFVIFVFMSKTKTTERRSVGGCGPLLVLTV